MSVLTKCPRAWEHALTPQPAPKRETCPLCGGPVLYKGLNTIECLGPDAGGTCENRARKGVHMGAAYEITYDDHGRAWMHYKR